MARSGRALCTGWALALMCSLAVSASASTREWSSSSGRILVGFRPEVPSRHVGVLLSAAGVRASQPLGPTGVQSLPVPPGMTEAAAIAAFTQRPEVAFAEPDRLVPPSGAPNDRLYRRQWHLPRVAAPAAWQDTTGSEGVIVAILDTGVDGAHPDLKPKLVPGWNFWDYNDDTRDVQGHGTAVAGAAAACSNNKAGVTGMAWNCRIMPLRIGNPDGYAHYSAMAEALVWAADQGARVANLSYEASGSATVAAAAAYFESKGGVVVMSSGNAGKVVDLQDNPHVLTVGATGVGDRKASWSNGGRSLDLVAPGDRIYTTNRGGGYGAWSGTSFSAPLVAGVAGLILSVNSDLTPTEVQQILRNSAKDLGRRGWDPSFGAGRVDAARAVKLAQR